MKYYYKEGFQFKLSFDLLKGETDLAIVCLLLLKKATKDYKQVEMFEVFIKELELNHNKMSN